MILSDQVRIGPSPIHGQGLFVADRPIATGEGIEYVGPRLSVKKLNGNIAANRYLYSFNDRYVIDGADENNLARWINHSCRPNCFAWPDGKRLLIRTVREILPREELTVDYGQDYFNLWIRPHGCRCPACLDPRPDVSIGSEGLFVTMPSGVCFGVKWSHEQRLQIAEWFPPTPTPKV
jgi:uncharacterized protein